MISMKKLLSKLSEPIIITKGDYLFIIAVLILDVISDITGLIG